VIRENCAELLSRAGFAVEGYATKEVRSVPSARPLPDLAFSTLRLATRGMPDSSSARAA